MYLTAMTHRDELFDLTLRWMNDDFHPDDGEAISRIFVYESAISSIAVERILRFLGRFQGTSLHLEQVRSKQELRERIIDSLGVSTPRTAALTQAFHANPKYFFPYLPIDAMVITDDTSRLLAIGRIKRMARVAEKVSFRLVEALFRELRVQARHLAEERARAAGVPLDAFISTPDAMQEDFVHAEEIVAHSFLDKTIHIEPGALAINDILGFKIIASQEDLDRVSALLGSEPDIVVREIERHSGNYNAVNLLLDVELPPEDVLATRLAGLDWDIARQRGLDPETIRRDAPDYLRQGATSVRVEIILTTPEELMEAEFGRSLHELRVLRLRQRQEYNGPLGQNAGYLIEYMLALATSPTIRVTEIPIKMYGRYLPEEVATLKHILFGTTPDYGMLGTFCPCPGHPVPL